jgi:thiol-disulfide isomerase/thioredoxin
MIFGKIAVPEMEKKKVYLKNMNTGATLDSTMVFDGAFAIGANVSEPFVGYLQTERLSQVNYYYLLFVAEPGRIYCDMVTDSLSGTPLNDRYYSMMKQYNYEVSVLNALTTQMNQAISMPADVAKEFADKFAKQDKVVMGILKSAYEENRTNPVGALAMENYLDWMVNYEAAKRAMEGAAPVVTSYQRLADKYAAMERLSHTAVGKPYKDLDLVDQKTGKKVKLSKYVEGKVALVDFWASWCRPCRKEIPNIAKLHEKYGKRKDVVIISLNVWDKPEPQAKAIKDMGMVWTQLTDPTRKATDTYAVDGIPQILLIGKDGRILARDLRGDEIEPALRKAIGE